MSNNLDLDQVAGNQNQKEVTGNDQAGQLDAALTEEDTFLITSSNARTLTAEEFRRRFFFIIDEDGGDPANGAIVLTVPAQKRGPFIIRNDTAFAVTVTISGQPVTAPVVPVGGFSILTCDATNVRSPSASASGINFVDLGDTPGSFSGASLFKVRVNAGETDLEFVTDGGAVADRAASSVPPFKGARAALSSDHALTAVTDNPISWGAEDFDTDDFHDNASDNERLTVPVGSGITKVILIATLNMSTPSSGTIHAYIAKNGGASPGEGGQSEDIGISGQDFMSITVGPIAVVEGDYFEVYINPANTGQLDNNNATRFTMYAIETDASGTAVGRGPFKGSLVKFSIDQTGLNSSPQVPDWGALEYENVENGLLKFWLGVDLTFTAANATEQLTATSHDLQTGDGPFRLTNSGGSLPNGLAIDTNYWAIRIDADIIQCAASYQDALDAVPVAFSDDGSGTHTLDRASRLVVPGNAISKIRLHATLAPVTGVASGEQGLRFLKNESGAFIGNALTGAATGASTDMLTTISPIIEVVTGDFFELEYTTDDAAFDFEADKSSFGIEVVEDADTAPYDISGFVGGVPSVATIITRFLVPRVFTIPEDMTTSQGHAETAPDAETDFDIRKNGGSVGTMRFASAANVATFIMGAETSFSPGDRFDIVTPADLNLLADLSYTIAGRR